MCPSALTRRFLSVAAAAVTAASCPGCSGVKKPAPIDAVFLIVVDTLRPDRLSCYGYQGHRTPAIDSLAASGVRFENAESPGSWTLPAMGAMLTSRYPTQLGLVERPPEDGKPVAWHQKRGQVRYTLPEGLPTLASLLDNAGYYPAAFVNQPFINAGDGFLQGFAEWCYTAGEDSIAWHDPATPMPNLVYPRGTDLGNADPLLVAEFGRWLARNADRHPFVWIHLLRPHWPYTPLLRYLPPDLQSPDAHVEPAVAYAAEVREADDMVRELLASIDATVGRKRSLVIFTSDHGEEFQDHGMYEHGHSLYREVVHVPLILSGPGLHAGSTVGTYASTLDLTPTLLELVGASERAPAGFEGRSLLPLIRQRASASPIYSEGMLYGSTKRSLIEDGYKLIFDAQGRSRFTLFDLGKDPLETTDVMAAQPERAARMEKSLSQHEARLLDDFAKLLGSSAAESPENQRILRAMRTLGYVGK
jgi:arylsulfatase A-like enzyme